MIMFKSLSEKYKMRKETILRCIYSHGYFYALTGYVALDNQEL